MQKKLLLTTAAISLATICSVAVNPATAEVAGNVSQVAINKSNETIIDLTESSDHLLDFSAMNKEVVGIAISTPEEFAKSFKIEPSLGDDQTLTVSSVNGGSSTQRIMLVTADDDGFGGGGGGIGNCFSSKAYNCVRPNVVLVVGFI